jgi:multiple sugar transport system permease protein
VLNAVVFSIPAIGYIILGGIFFMILFFFAKRLFVHDKYVIGLLCFLAGVALFLFFFNFARPMLTEQGIPWYAALFRKTQEPYRWLLDPKSAMFCCVLPMVWAGMGPGCLIYLAALKGIAEDFYEAADIDGASFIDKILFVVIPILKPLLIIQFIGVFIASWQSEAFILAMTGGASNTEVAGLHIFYKAYMYLKFGPAVAMAWVLGFMLIGFTVHQLRILARLEFKTTGNK